MARFKTLTALRSRTLKDHVVKILRDAILAGEIRPGERLNESDLSRRLKVSRAPIREALQLLQQQGLATNHPHRGMFVVHLDDEDTEKINSLRIILEAEAMKLARFNHTPEGERNLKSLLSKMESMVPGPAAELARIDLEFHRTVWALSGNEYLERTLTGLAAPLFAHALLLKTKKEKSRMILESHRPILAFVLDQTLQSAEDIMLAHLRLSWHHPNRYCSLSHPLAQTPAAVGDHKLSTD
jgi:DNA-binding GntR family transcriptional regulator